MQKMTQSFEKCEERSFENQTRVLEIVEKQIEESNARQISGMRGQLEEMHASLSKIIEEKSKAYVVRWENQKRDKKG